MKNTDTHQRLIIEMGMGNDLHGMDYTKACKRAIEDAFRHSSLPIFGATGLTPDQMIVQVTVRGQATVTAVMGGLNVPSGDETIVVAQASVEAFLPRQTGWSLKS